MRPHTLVIACIALLAAQTLCAQSRFFLGATAGASSTSFSGDIPENGSYTSKTGFSIGLVGEYALWQDIRLSVQPSYSRRGTGVADDIGEVDPRDSLRLTLDYISIPVMARFLTPSGSWSVNGGLELSVLLSASLKDINAGNEQTVDNLINSIDVAMVVGVAKTFPIDPMVLSVEIRYSQSILNAGGNNELASSLGISPRFRSSGFQILVAVLFPL